MKRTVWWRACAAVVWCVGVGLALNAQAAQPLPLDAFANLPMVTSVQLSPDGQRIATLINAGDNTVLAVRDVAGSPTMKALLKTDNKQFRFGWIRWVNDERLLVSIAFPSQRGWTEVSETRLLSISRDGGEPVNLVRRSSFDHADRPAQFQDQVIDWLPEDGQHVLMQLDDDGRGDPDVFRVDVNNGRRQVVHRGRKNVVRWITDRSHRVRVGLLRDDNDFEVLVCSADGSNWRTAWRYKQFDRNEVEPLGFGADADKLYVRADHEGREAIFEVDLTDPALPRKLLLSHPKWDIGGDLLIAPKTGAAIGVDTGVLAESGGNIWDAEYKQLARGIDQALPDRYNRVLQFSADGARYLLYSSGNGVPGSYLVGLRDKGQLSPLAETYPGLAGKALPVKRGYTVKARDGMAVPVLLTLPNNLPKPAEGRELKNLPTVLLPHGGPISLDNYAFDPWVQFLADRGYAVLQVNFRGSSGLGHDHMSAGLKRWGLEMQDDLTDAVKWLVDRGTADPARICVVGASYGGYAALMGAAKTPELYRCVLSFAGVTDLIDLGDHRRQFIGGKATYEEMVGSTWSDRDRLKATSPRRLASQIQAPVLLIHGTLDRSVPFEQGADMADALKSAGKRYRFIKQEDGDHHLSHQAHRTQFFREMEAFLAENIGKPAAPSVTVPLSPAPVPAPVSATASATASSPQQP